MTQLTDAEALALQVVIRNELRAVARRRKIVESLLQAYGYSPDARIEIIDLEAGLVNITAPTSKPD